LFASKLLNKEFKNYFVTVFARYLLYVIIAAEVLILPKLLEETTYADYEYLKNLVFMAPYALFGSYSGFIYLKYTYKKDFFGVLFTSGIFFSLIIGSVLSIYFRNIYFLLIVMSINLFTILEQRLKVDNKFIVAFSFKPILSILVLLSAWIAMQLSFDISPILLLSLSVILGFVIWMIISKSYGSFHAQKIEKKLFLRYFILVKKGLPINLATVFLSFFLFTDRFFIDKYYPDYLGTYSFGFNVSQILVLALTTIGYVSAIKIGEIKEELSKEKLKKTFKYALLIYIIMLIGLVCGLFILKEFYSFDGLILITLLLSYSKGFYFLLGIISSVVFYFNYQILSLKIIALIFSVNVLTSFMIIGAGYSVYYLLAMSSLLLLLYSLTVLYIIFVKIDYDELVTQAQLR